MAALPGAVFRHDKIPALDLAPSAKAFGMLSADIGALVHHRFLSLTQNGGFYAASRLSLASASAIGFGTSSRSA